VLEAKPAAYWRLNEDIIPIADDASGNGHDATFEDGVALFLPGASRTVGFQPPQPETPNAFSGDRINRAVHLAGGRGLSCRRWRDVSVELWFGTDSPTARPVTGYLFSRGTAAASPLRATISASVARNPARRDLILLQRQRTQHRPRRSNESPGQWHQVVLVREGKRVAVYLDGNPTRDPVN
jgi:hypothetical protein